MKFILSVITLQDSGFDTQFGLMALLRHEFVNSLPRVARGFSLDTVTGNIERGGVG